MHGLAFRRFAILLAAAMLLAAAVPVRAAEEPAKAAAAESAAARGTLIFQKGQLNFQELLKAGGLIGYVTILLSFGMVALIVEQLFTTRRGAILPRGLADQAYQLIAAGKYKEAETLAQSRPSFLGFLLDTGLRDVDLGYAAVEKAMEDAAVEQSARLLRKVEYLTVIGALAPMLGLMGTVWGMIQAFAEFAERANPSPADFAPSISVALVTTFFGLVVAVPAISAFAFLRNRVDELAAEAAITAGHVMSPLKRVLIAKKPAAAPAPRPAAEPQIQRPAVPPVVAEREPRR
jgi:biopolymer transport protein ExbB